jgi:anti-sigma B factor antagonist
MDLMLQVEECDGWAVVRASGDLDLTTAPRLREAVVGVVVSGQPKVVLELQAVDFIDSTGLGVLVGLLKRARSQGGDLRLVSTRSSLRKVLELTGLDRALPLATSVEGAISDAVDASGPAGG